jgi:hypothetical protein
MVDSKNRQHFFDYAAKAACCAGSFDDWIFSIKPHLTKPDSLKVAKVLKIKQARLLLRRIF